MGEAAAAFLLGAAVENIQQFQKFFPVPLVQSGQKILVKSVLRGGFGVAEVLLESLVIQK